MLDLAPSGLLRGGRFSGPGTAATAGERRKRVILLAGCAQQVLRPEINDATIRLLPQRRRRGGGAERRLLRRAGAPLGREPEAVIMAKRNVDAWSRLWRRAVPIDAVVINASGCGTTVKDYGHMLKHEPAYAERAATISGMTRDVTEFLSSYDMGPPRRWSSLRVAYHSACSMQHGQRIIDEPRKLLRDAGFSVVEVPEGHLCCGSAGTYNILQPDIARDLRDRKVANIRACGPTGRDRQHRLHHPARRRHGHSHRAQLELLDWAYGGPVPRGLEALARHVHDVPEAQPVLALT